MRPNGYSPSMKNAGQLPLARARKGLSVVARPALAGPTPESVRDAAIIREQQPVLCGQLMAMSQAQRAIAAERAVRAFYGRLTAQPSRDHMKNVTVALQAQCWEAQMGRKYPTPTGPAAESGEGGNATQPDPVLGMSKVWDERQGISMPAEPKYQALLPETEGEQRYAGQIPLATAFDGGRIIVTPAASTDEREFRAYGEYLVSQMGPMYQDACMRVGQAPREQAFVAALAEVDRYLAWLNPELFDIVNGRRDDVTNRDANYLNFRVGNDRNGRRAPWDARTWLMNVRDRAARRLVELCARPAPPLVTFSVRPIVLWREPAFFRRPMPRSVPAPAPTPTPAPSPAPAPATAPAPAPIKAAMPVTAKRRPLR